ncbi:MAG: hypothetical protein ACKVP7_22990 [Hyphomicrobiaceae bacterium]
MLAATVEFERATWKVAALGVVLAAGHIGTAATASAACRDVTVSAMGVEKTDIDAATASASDALVAKIAATYGPTWGVGSHRHGSFHCDKALGGRKPGWVCSAKTTVICAA